MRTLKILAYLLGAALGVVYLLNPGAGVVELIPDNLPILGNLDEAAAIGLLLSCFHGLKALKAEKAEKAEARALAAPGGGTELEAQAFRKAESTS